MIDWDAIKIRFEAGETPREISNSLRGTPTRQGIYKRASLDEWQRLEIDRPDDSLPVEQSYWDELKDSQKIVLMAFAKGATTIEAAAQRADVHESTIHRWKKDERFARLCTAARLSTRDKLVNRIMDAGGDDWKANGWLLERMYKDEFAPANQSQGFTGNTFNVLGRLSLGIERPRKQEDKSG